MTRLLARMLHWCGISARKVKRACVCFIWMFTQSDPTDQCRALSVVQTQKRGALLWWKCKSLLYCAHVPGRASRSIYIYIYIKKKKAQQKYLVRFHLRFHNQTLNSWLKVLCVTHYWTFTSNPCWTFSIFAVCKVQQLLWARNIFKNGVGSKPDVFHTDAKGRGNTLVLVMLRMRTGAFPAAFRHIHNHLCIQLHPTKWTTGPSCFSHFSRYAYLQWRGMDEQLQ